MENTKSYEKDELRKLQLKSLEMLLYFKKICDENNLEFYFCSMNISLYRLFPSKLFLVFHNHLVS